MTGLRLFARGFAIVFLTAANVHQIAVGRTGGAFVVGCLISLLWWGNANQSAHSTVAGARWWYALGAGCGTVCGMTVSAGLDQWLR